jgi:hypothetical protein
MPIGKTNWSGPPTLDKADHLRNEQFADPITLHELFRVWYISRDFYLNGNVNVLVKLMDCEVWGHCLPIHDLVKKILLLFYGRKTSSSLKSI